LADVVVVDVLTVDRPGQNALHDRYDVVGEPALVFLVRPVPQPDHEATGDERDLHAGERLHPVEAFLVVALRALREARKLVLAVELNERTPACPVSLPEGCGLGGGAASTSRSSSKNAAAPYCDLNRCPVSRNSPSWIVRC
jgi:hypothetical protein